MEPVVRRNVRIRRAARHTSFICQKLREQRRRFRSGKWVIRAEGRLAFPADVSGRILCKPRENIQRIPIGIIAKVKLRLICRG